MAQPGRRRIIAVAVAVAVAVLGVASLTTTARLPLTIHDLATNATYRPLNYVALGDSYSAGEGAEAYRDDSGSCRRSARAFPQLWAEANHPDSFRSVACSGARVADVRSHQLSALDDQTTLVSITVGGNDVGFARIMTACVSRGPFACSDEVDKGIETLRHELPGQLDALYAAISAAAPQARIVVLGYPRFYASGKWLCPGLLPSSRNSINRGIDQLDSVIEAAAHRHGFVFADVRDTFSGHGLCSGNTWLHAVNVHDMAESYHPTADGQRSGYLPAFTPPARDA